MRRLASAGLNPEKNPTRITRALLAIHLWLTSLHERGLYNLACDEEVCARFGEEPPNGFSGWLWRVRLYFGGVIEEVLRSCQKMK